MLSFRYQGTVRGTERGQDETSISETRREGGASKKYLGPILLLLSLQALATRTYVQPMSIFPKQKYLLQKNFNYFFMKLEILKMSME